MPIIMRQVMPPVTTTFGDPNDLSRATLLTTQRVLSSILIAALAILVFDWAAQLSTERRFIHRSDRKGPLACFFLLSRYGALLWTAFIVTIGFIVQSGAMPGACACARYWPQGFSIILFLSEASMILRTCALVGHHHILPFAQPLFANPFPRGIPLVEQFTSSALWVSHFGFGLSRD